MSDVVWNIWGTNPLHVCEGYCRACEREGGRHYSTCPARRAGFGDWRVQ